jgi:carbamoylphosphate synthase large subunit
VLGILGAVRTGDPVTSHEVIEDTEKVAIQICAMNSCKPQGFDSGADSNVALLALHS